MLALLSFGLGLGYNTSHCAQAALTFVLAGVIAVTTALCMKRVGRGWCPPHPRVIMNAVRIARGLQLHVTYNDDGEREDTHKHSAPGFFSAVVCLILFARYTNYGIASLNVDRIDWVELEETLRGECSLCDERMKKCCIGQIWAIRQSMVRSHQVVIRSHMHHGTISTRPLYVQHSGSTSWRLC